MATLCPHKAVSALSTGFLVVAFAAAYATPAEHQPAPVAEFVPASPDIQDVTIEHGESPRPEHLMLCESPGTFIPFEKPIERQVYDVLTAYKTGMNDTLERLTAKVIVAESSRYGLDPWFIVGVIRVESRFNNFAESNKGARGLMQVMPFVGEELAGDLGIHWTGADSLFNPVKNVKMGVAYLALLNQSFKGDKDKIHAAYNMGPNRVRRWMAAGRDLPTDYASLVQEYGELLGNIGTQTIAGTDLVGRITMIERNMAKKREVVATIAEIPDSDVATDEAHGSVLAAEPAIEPLDEETSSVTANDGGLLDALMAEEAQTPAPSFESPEPPIQAPVELE